MNTIAGKAVLALFIACGALSVRAQHTLRAQSVGDNLELTYTVQPLRPGSDYKHVITPMLCGQGDTVRLNPTTLRGGRNARKYHRYMKLYHKGEQELPYTKVRRRDKNVEPIVGVMVINTTNPNFAWTRTQPVSLCVLTESEGCCKTDIIGWACTDPVQFEEPVVPQPAFIPLLADVEDNTGVAGQLMKDNPVLVHISKYRPYDNSQVLRKQEGMLYVHFPLDKIDLRRDFRDNAPILDKIVDITRKIMADSTSRVEKIQIIGLASVEGPVKRNLWLGEGRANALKQYVQARVNVPDAMFECTNGGEAWAELRDQINDDTNNVYRQQMLDIIDNEPNVDLREAKLKRLDGGKAYAYLRDNVLSDQRNSGYVRIYYDYVPDANAATINKATQLLRQERYDEALALLRTVQGDERACNALGVALYMTGQTDQGITYFRRAAANGDSQAKENLDRLKIER